MEVLISLAACGLILLLASRAFAEGVVDPVVLEKSLKVKFQTAYNAATAVYPDVCTTVPSNATDEKYGWLGSAPVMREWVDERQPAGLLDHDYTIVNKHYEASIEVDLDDLEDDQTGGVQMRVKDMGSRAKRHPDSLLTTLISNGESDLCYDGQAFFDTDHSEGSSGTQDNDLTSTVVSTTALTLAEAQTIIWAQIQALLSYLDDRGEPYLEEWEFNSSNLIFMISRHHQRRYEEALHSNLISNTDNTLLNKGRVVVNPRITGATKLYCFYVGGPIKPFIFQDRKGLKTGMTGAQSDSEFNTNFRVFGADARYNLGYGLWQFAVLTTIST